LGLLLVVASLALAVLVFWSGQPRSGGRTLRSWLEQCSDTPLSETQRLAQAQEAVRAIGARKALPTLLSLVETRENPMRTWIFEKTQEQHVLGLYLRSAIDCQSDGIAGFEALGTNCSAAVGELTKLLDDKELAFVAVRCLDYIGKSAEQALCQCVTNRDEQVRSWSISALASVTDDVEVYINRIEPLLADVDPGVRCDAVEAIGLQNDAPQLAVPLLISALSDTDDHVCDKAVEGLMAFGTNSFCAFSTLTNLASTGRDSQCGAALKALVKIMPREATATLSNVVVNGNPRTLGTALGGLKTTEPELGLEMLLAELRSTDAARLQVALELAGTYEAETPGIAEALKSAVVSRYPDIASCAMATMRAMLWKQKEKSGAVLQIPGEPSYEGKSLGEWLAMRRNLSELSTNAVEALRAMGTNVLPALLTRLTYKEPIFNLDDYEVSMGAATALIAMGEQSKPALPSLTAMMDCDNSNLVLRVMIATLGTGADAIPCLMKGLTNQFAQVRSEAAHFLAEWGEQFPEQRKQAIPYIVTLLNDPDVDVRRSAVGDLKEINAQAATKTVGK
jgi:HEAT repeat protein